MTEWVVVVPVKGTAAAKSRLGGDPAMRLALARAMALDTVEAALAASGVAEVIVVTGPQLADAFASLGATVLDDPGQGLIAAIEEGLAYVGGAVPAAATAVLLGDVPALRSEELGAALAAASAHPLAMVADADGSGTVLTCAAPAESHALRFGRASRAGHVAHGYVELTGPWPGLRRDVDTDADLEGLDVGELELGSRTRDVLGR